MNPNWNACAATTNRKASDFMAIDYVIDYDCVPKQQLGTQNLLERLKDRDRAEAIIDLYRKQGDQRPPSEMGFEYTRRTPEGDDENAVIVVQDLLDEAATLKPYEAHCQGCPANRTGTPFGCTGFIQYPLTEKGESWLLNQLPTPQEPLIWLLLKQGVDNFQYDGQQVAQLRQTDDTYFEARQPARRSLGEFTLTANQIFEMMFMVGNIIPNHAGVLLLFFNAVERERMQADTIMQMTPATPEKVNEYPFMHQVLPSDDRTTRELKAFLHALYIAWALNEKLLVDA